MAYIFGSNFDSLANQRNQADATNIAFAQRQQELAQRAQDADRSYQFADAQAAQSRQDQQAKSFSEALQAKQALDQQKYQFGASQAQDKSAFGEKVREFDIGTKQNEDQLTQQKAQADAADTSRQLQDLVKMAQSGSIPADADMGQLFPKLTPAQISWAKQFAGQDKIEQDKDVAAAAVEATALVNKSQTPAAPGKHFWNSATPASSPITESAAMGQLAANKDYQHYVSLLQWDGANQRFVPKAAASQFQFASPASPLAMPPVPPPVPPQAGGTVPTVMPNAPRAPFSPMVQPAAVVPNPGGPVITRTPPPAWRSVTSMAPPAFMTPQDVKAAYQSGSITRQQAAQYLSQFPPQAGGS